MNVPKHPRIDDITKDMARAKLQTEAGLS